MARKIEAEGGDLRRANKVNCPKMGQEKVAWAIHFARAFEIPRGPRKIEFCGEG